MQKNKVNEITKLLKNPSPTPIRNKILVATPTLGIIRVEWAAARYGQIIPCNWSYASTNLGFSSFMPMGFLVAEAQNLAVKTVIEQGYEWLLLLEDDTIPPLDLFVKLNEYMRKADVPVVSGLYFTKSAPAEPLVYRGRGNSFYADWKLGDKVWVDGVPTGCLLIHSSILKLMWAESEEYVTAFDGIKTRRVFETPSKIWTDPETQIKSGAVGTSDLYWCDRVIRDKVLERSGWKKIAKKKYPFLVDTTIACGHVDLSSGTVYPIGGIK